MDIEIGFETPPDAPHPFWRDPCPRLGADLLARMPTNAELHDERHHGHCDGCLTHSDLQVPSIVVDVNGKRRADIELAYHGTPVPDRPMFTTGLEAMFLCLCWTCEAEIRQNNAKLQHLASAHAWSKHNTGTRRHVFWEFSYRAGYGHPKLPGIGELAIFKYDDADETTDDKDS